MFINNRLTRVGKLVAKKTAVKAANFVNISVIFAILACSLLWYVLWESCQTWQDTPRLVPWALLLVSVTLLCLWGAYRRLNRSYVNVATALANVQDSLYVKEQEYADFQRFFSNSGDLLSMIDIHDHFIRNNHAWQAITGYALSELQGEAVKKWLHADDLQTFTLQMQALKKSSLPKIVQELRFKFSNGEYRWLLWSVTYDDEVKKSYVVARDITDFKHMQTIKDGFISTVNHELRTPLTSINGSLKLILGKTLGEIPAASFRLIEIANKNCERLIRMINDILDIDRIESGALDFTFKKVSLSQIVQQAIVGNESYAKQFSVKMALVARCSHDYVYADADRIRQVIDNLLSNAIKFSPADSVVKLSVSKKDLCYRVSITDEGRGIPEAFRGRIFDKFAQVDVSDSRDKGGTGLGLHICQLVIQHHQGTIDYSSQPDQGTTFYFELPAYGM